jgi:hypothetical protein
MLTVIFVITTVVCALGWFLEAIAVKAVGKWIRKKGYELPADEELKACSLEAFKETLHIK